ncbi:MAG: acyl-CoA desaturase [Bacteroidota bacterium]
MNQLHSKAGLTINNPASGSKQQIRFSNKKEEKGFYLTLRQRVNAYFKDNKLSKHANSQMLIKTIFILTVFVGTYVMLISNLFSPGVLLLIALVHGFFTALIGLNIAHDAVHGSYTNNPRLNKLIGVCFNIIGANDYMWKINHNSIHHSYTNIPDHDGDIEQIPLIRLHPEQDRWWIHRFQYIYIFFFYSLTSFFWVLLRDYVEFFHPKIKEYRTDQPAKEFGRMVLYKCIYYVFFLVIPLMVIELPWYYILLGFLAMHMIEGLTLALIFQLAHVIEGTNYPMPDESGKMERSWAAHQMFTTANFGCSNNFLNYICGGLNFQIEHHLFPNICHVHYKALAPIVKQTAQEYNLPYIEHPTYFGALNSHIRVLKRLGTQDT